MAADRESPDARSGRAARSLGGAPESALAKLGLPAPVLSHRERLIVRLAVQGLCDREIARRLLLSPETVRRLLGAAFTKLASPRRA
jgi:DNA-binding CsgD family transcriptional regulator